MDTKAGIMHKVSRMSHGDLMRKKAELLQQKRALRESGAVGKKQPCCVIAIKGGYKNLEVSIPMKPAELTKYVGRNFSRLDFVHNDTTYVLYYDSNAQVRNKVAKKLFNRWFVGNVVILGTDKDTVMAWKSVDLEASSNSLQSNTILEQGEPITLSSGVTLEDCSEEIPSAELSSCSSESGCCSGPSISELLGATEEEWERSTNSDVEGEAATEERWERSTTSLGPQGKAGDRGM